MVVFLEDGELHMISTRIIGNTKSKVKRTIVLSRNSLLPARRLAETGQTVVRKKQTGEPVDRSKFKAKLKVGKPSNYPHQFWGGVSAKTEWNCNT
jgi:hypothetical protein